MKFSLRFLLLPFLLVSTLLAGSFPDISHDELKSALAAGKVTLLDVNGSKSFQAGHIPGAIDFASQGEKLASLLPADKGALIVAYCGNPNCKAYKKGAEAAQKLGYTNVKHYSQGIQGWKTAGEAVGKP